jgi:uncharacterized flavoprotein (TIGR03862 family)
MTSTDKTPPVAVIVGGGPAGLMAAEVLATAGWTVDLHERMPSLGRKLLMAGRGGLNLTHSEPLDRFLQRYGDTSAEVKAAIEAFPPADVIAWAKGLGEETFVGSSGRVFPKRMKTSPLLRAWLKRLDGLGVRFHVRSRWAGWDASGGLVFDQATGDQVVAHPDATILALGGASWPRLGSDGGWVPLLTGEGVAVTPLTPSNCGFMIAWSDYFRTRFAGDPLKRIAVTLGDETVLGEAIVTAEGLEGGALYALGARIRAALAAGPVRLVLDLRPGLSTEDLVKSLAKARKGDTVTNTLRKAGLSPSAVGLLREAHGRDLPDNPFALAAAIKAAPVTIAAAQPIDRAISTAGGVAASDLDDAFMLRARRGVFVAGEMLDWDAPTGGYLLQASFATAVAAARGAIAWVAQSVPQDALDDTADA